MEAGFQPFCQCGAPFGFATLIRQAYQSHSAGFEGQDTQRGCSDPVCGASQTLSVNVFRSLCA